MDKKKVVFFTGGMGRGGAERVISILANHYIQKGWQVDILMLLHNIVGYELDAQIRLTDISECGYASKILAVRKYIKKERPDVMVSFMGEICSLTALSALGTGCRLISSERLDPAMSGRSWMLKRAVDFAYRCSDTVVFQTQRAMNYFGKGIRAKGVIIPNPVGIKASVRDDRLPRIVTAGRLVPQKNQRMLICAFAKLHEIHPEYTLDIFGEGPLEEELRSVSDKMGLGSAVNFMGNVPDLHEKIGDAEMFVLSSDYEGLSNALIEATMMGHACISTDCAGSDEIITDGRDGLIVPVGDTEKLAEAMLRLAEDKEFARGLGRNAALKSEKFKKENVLSEWESIIEG